MQRRKFVERAKGFIHKEQLRLSYEGEGHHLAASGAWRGWAPMQLLGQGLNGKTLGVVGLGRIGKEVARRAFGFGMTVLYHNRNRDQEAERELGSGYRDKLRDLLGESDVVSLNAPLTNETRHLIGQREFGLMKPTAVLVNTAPSGVVSETGVAGLTLGVLGHPKRQSSD